MKWDIPLFVAFLAAFLRTSAMFLATPLFGGVGIPIMVRVYFAGAVSLALSPLIYGNITTPETLYDLLPLAFHEISFGLALGFCVNLVLSAAESAGAFLDMQIGLGLASVLVPNTEIPTSILSRFKFMLALVLLFVTNGHHILMNALVRSYTVNSTLNLESSLTTLLDGLASFSMLTLQIALPVAAASFMVDVALGMISRAVPQINILMAGLSAKLLVGILALSLALPALGYGISEAIDTFGNLLTKLLK